MVDNKKSIEEILECDAEYIYSIAHSTSTDRAHILIEEYLNKLYLKGWGDGMSEGKEHAEQLQAHRERYE